MLKRFVAIFLALCIVILPVLAIAQEAGQAIMQARMDAVADVSGCIWMGGGFLFGIFAVGVAYVIGSSPSASRLLGKSPEYVAAYADEYMRRCKSIRVTNSIIGCLGGAVLYLIVWSAAQSAE